MPIWLDLYLLGGIFMHPISIFGFLGLFCVVQSMRRRSTNLAYIAGSCLVVTFFLGMAGTSFWLQSAHDYFIDSELNALFYHMVGTSMLPLAWSITLVALNLAFFGLALGAQAFQFQRKRISLTDAKKG